MPKIDNVSDLTLNEILTPELFIIWQEIVSIIESAYDMEKNWYSAGKEWKYELKFQRSGKTLVSLLLNIDGNCIGLMIIFGKTEREKIEAQQSEFPKAIMDTYHAATTYHDGKWAMFLLPFDDLEKNLLKILLVKRKPNKKY